MGLDFQMKKKYIYILSVSKEGISNFDFMRIGKSYELMYCIRGTANSIRTRQYSYLCEL